MVLSLASAPADLLERELSGLLGIETINLGARRTETRATGASDYFPVAQTYGEPINFYAITTGSGKFQPFLNRGRCPLRLVVKRGRRQQRYEDQRHLDSVEAIAEDDYRRAV